MNFFKKILLLSLYFTGLSVVVVILDPSMSNSGVFLFVALLGIALFKLMQGFKIIFISEFKTLDESTKRERFNDKTGELYTEILDDHLSNGETTVKTFYPFKASRMIKLSTLFTLLSYSSVIYFLIENQSIFILWFVLIILYFVSIAPITILGNFYQHQEWGDDVKKRTGSRGGTKDKRYKSGYRVKPTYYTYYTREVLYKGPDYLKLWEKSFSNSWLWIFCSTLVIPFI